MNSADPGLTEGLPAAAVGRADLVRALARDGEDGLAAMARLLGYEAQPSRRKQPTESQEEAKAAQPVAEALPDEEAGSGFHPVPFWRPVEAELNPEEELGRMLMPPPVEPETAMATEADFEAKEDSGAQRVPAPIVAWPRLWRVLDDRLRTATPRSEIDVRELVDRWARGENVERLPCLEGLVHSRVLMILDRSPPLLPFRLDQLRLAGELVRRLGAASVRVATVQGSESLVTARDEQVLALTDLGSYGGDGRKAFWRRLGERLRRSGVARLALVPCPPSLWPTRSAELWSAVEWSDPTNRPVHRQESGDADVAGSVETLLSLASPAIRLEVGLIRDLRRLVPGADIDTELEFFKHRAVASRSARGVSLEKDQARRRLDFFLELPESMQREAIAVLDSWHRSLAPEIWAEEVLGLLAHGVPKNWFEAGTAETAEELFEKLCLLVEQGDPESSSFAGEAEAYFERFKGRASRPVWSYPRLRRSLARAVRAISKRGGEDEPSAGATPEMFIPSAEEIERWTVWHEGSEFRIRRFGEAGQGSRLADLSARGPGLLAGDGVTSDHELELSAETQRFPLPGGGRPIGLASDVETLWMELWEPPEWATAAGRDDYGLWASFEVEGVAQRMRWIPPGRFQMGSPESEAGRFDNEGPCHWVVLSEGYWLAETTCTQELWGAVMGEGENPSHFKDSPQSPVEQVSWDDCQAFVDRLNFTVRGLEVRLPTEAEWEYACRAGTDTPTWSGSEESEFKRIAWYRKNSQNRTHKVGQKLANPWGLLDMLGNVWEWCWDYYGNYGAEIVVDPEGPGKGAERVLRGGAWYVNARYVRAAIRGGLPPEIRSHALGFRLSRGQGLGAQGAERQVAGSERVGRGTSPRRRSRRDSAWVERLGWATDGGVDGFGRWAKFEVAGVAHRLRWIVPGRFFMGSAENEAGRWDDEGPRHEVTLTRGFWLGETPCTQDLWLAVMGENPSHFQSPRRPVEQVSWEDVHNFIEQLNHRLPELNGRLPTEAQWEYACRAGTRTATWSGDLKIRGERNAPLLDSIAWYGGNSGVGFELENGVDSSDWPERQYPHTLAGTREVGLKRANLWGLYDMLGNVDEWCSDYWDTSYPAGQRTDPTGPREGAGRVFRGGAWLDGARLVRAAYRGGNHPGIRRHSLGFRLSRGQDLGLAEPEIESKRAEPESRFKQAWRKLRGRPPRDEA